MRSSESTSGNPWPDDMMITVEEQPLALLELLWVRESYELTPRGEDLPPSLLDAPSPIREAAIDAERRKEWADAWPRMWRAALAHICADHSRKVFDKLHTTLESSTEQADILRHAVGPRWRDAFGNHAFDTDLYREWLHRLEGSHSAAIPLRVEDHPERRDLAALIPAWRAGLETIVTIPCSGEYTRKVGDNSLLITARTRKNSDDYRRALNTFN